MALNLAKDSASWQRTISVTPLSRNLRRGAALQVASRAQGADHGKTAADCLDLLQHLGLHDPSLHSTAGETTAA